MLFQCEARRTLTVHAEFSKLGSLLGSFFIKVPYYFGDLEREPL